MVQVYSAANIINATETVEVLATALKKKVYPDASVITQTESVLTELGLNWFLSDIRLNESDMWLSQVETNSACQATASIRQFPAAIISSSSESYCESLAIWPEPPAPTASVSCAGKDLHKQVLRHGNSHQISVAIDCEQTTIAAVDLLQIIFEVTQPNSDISVFKKTRFGAPGGIILDLIKDQAEGKILLLADLQLRPNQISFSGEEVEFDFVLAVENSTINQRAEVATGTLILSKD